jgi:ribosomal protein S18 acetylase RimI-like enzyme
MKDSANVASVNVASSKDGDKLVSAIVLGFANDPVARWTWPNPHDFLIHFPKFTKAFGGKAFDYGTAHSIAEFAGGALWLPPGVGPDEEALDSIVKESVEPARLEVVSMMMEKMGSYHPAEPHWYLPLIAVDPAKQGLGYGSTLLRYALERIDRDNQIAYLESTNPRNIPLYERHGFEVIGTIQVADGPPLFPMIRPAR